MEEIIQRLMENHRLDEMALDRDKLIDRCMSLGRKFIDHYHEIYRLGAEDRDYDHHCGELQGWYASVKDLVFKHNHKKISKTQLIDWFFTRGSSIEELFPEDREAEIYEEFILKILSTDESISEILSELLNS